MFPLSATMRYFLSVVFILTYNFGGGSSDLENIKDNFASINNLTLLAATEQDFYNIFKRSYNQGDYDKETSILKSALERYFADFEDSNIVDNGNESEKRKNDFSMAKPKEVSSNPILPYRMLYRIEKYREVLEIIGNITFTLSDGTKSNLWELAHIYPEAIPTKNDVDEAMRSILRLHITYELNLTEFTSGVIAGINTNARLNAFHCYKIGIFASQEGYYDLSIEWLEAAYSKVYFESDSSVDRDTIDHALLASINNHDAALSNTYTGAPIRTVYNDTLLENYIVPQNYSTSINRTRRKAVEYKTWNSPKDSIYNEMRFWALCSGKNYQTEKEKSQLYCWLNPGKNKVNIVNPSKMELLSTFPYIVQIYDVISPKLSESIAIKAENGYKRSEVIDYNSTNQRGKSLSKSRTSANAWLYTKNDTKDLIALEKQIESITGLKAADDASEALQVASYVFGRHYDVHTDTIKNSVMAGSRGDRIATFLIYLEEPLAGGSTAFTEAGIAAKPAKGSAVFWYNLYKNGTAMDGITWHGACPVLLGHKSVGNKWIRYNPQFLSFPCPLDQNDTKVNVPVM